jgi:hypothetical protein
MRKIFSNQIKIRGEPHVCLRLFFLVFIWLPEGKREVFFGVRWEEKDENGSTFFLDEFNYGLFGLSVFIESIFSHILCNDLVSHLVTGALQ